MSLIGWWKLDGDAYDSSPSRNNGANTGVTFDPLLGKTGQGGIFVGGNSSSINITQIDITTHHTICFWMYGNNEGPGAIGSMLLGEVRTAATSHISVINGDSFNIHDGTLLRSWLGSGGTDVDYFHRWRHVAIVFDVDEVELFIDGATQETNDYDGTFIFNNMGASHSFPGFDYQGHLNDIRVYDNTLSLKEIKDIAQAKVLHWEFSHERNVEGDLILDSSGFDRHATLDASKPVWSSVTGRGVGCYDFDNKYIQISAADFPVEFDKEITISLWMNGDTLSDWEILLHGTATGSVGFSYFVAVDGNTSKVYFWTPPAHNDQCVVDTIETGVWYHICATYNGTQKFIYFNGVEKLGGVSRTDPIGTHQNGVKIGVAGGGAYPFDGKLADVRIYNKGFTEAEAVALYQKGAQLDKKGNLWC